MGMQRRTRYTGVADGFVTDVNLEKGTEPTMCVAYDANDSMHVISFGLHMVHKKKHLFFEEKEETPALGNVYYGRIVKVHYDPNEPKVSFVEGN